MTPGDLSEVIVGALQDLVDEGAVRLVDGVPAAVAVELPRHTAHGDYSTNVALRLARPAGLAPRVLAGLLATRLAATDAVASVDVAGPGFLNVHLAPADLGSVAPRVVEAGPSYGSSELYHGETIHLALAFDRSEAPTPLGAARLAVVGDALARILQRCGARVSRDPHGPEVRAGHRVTLVSAGRPVHMSRTVGRVTTFEDLVDAVGADAATYALSRCPLSTTAHGSLAVDLDLWARQSGDNPVYDVQYAHARSASILRNASDLGLGPAEPDVFDPAQLRHPEESALLRVLAELPQVLATAAQRREPHRVAHYLEDTASGFHRFQGTCPVLPVGDEEPSPSHAARLLLVDATRIVLANGLEMLGVCAPSRM